MSYPHDPRAGVLDASLVVIVRQQSEGCFRIVETFFGDKQAGELLFLPDFELIDYEANTVEPIKRQTRILLFLQRKQDDSGGWEVTQCGRCYFWVHTWFKVNRLRQMAKDTVALKRQWEAARDIPDERKRVEALWEFLWNNDWCFHKYTKAELEKIGATAGDYTAEQMETLDMNQRRTILRDIGVFGSVKSHNILLTHLWKLQQTFEEYAEEQGVDWKGITDNWESVPTEIKDINGKLFYGLDGLASFKDSSDLPYIRELARWAVKYRFQQVCEVALRAFREMPEKENLPVMEAIWGEFSGEQWKGDRFPPNDMVLALESHPYPEAVPLLVKFLKDGFSGDIARKALAEILGKDSG